MESHNFSSAAASDKEDREEILDVLGDAVLIFDAATGTINRVNRQLGKLLGLSLAELQWLKVPDLVNHGHLPPAVDAAGPERQEWQIKDRAGRQLKVEARLSRTSLQGREQVCAVLREIGDREGVPKEAPDTLLHQFFSAIPDFLVLKDLDLVYRVVNPAFCRYLGKPAAEIIGKTDFDLFPQAEAEIYRRDDLRVIESGVPLVQDEEVTGAGGREWLQVSKTPFFDETSRLAGMLCAVRDIHQRKEMEEALRQSEQRYRAIVEDQAELVSRFLPDTTITFVNEAGSRYFGKTPQELCGTRLLDFIPEAEQHSFLEVLGRLNQENPLAVIEHRMINTRGEIRWQQWTNRAIFDEHGYLQEYQAVGRDITEHRLAEQALQASEDNYRTIFNAVNDGIAVVDLETGNFLDVNQKWCQMTGYSPEEARGLNVAALCLDEPPYTGPDAMHWILEASRDKPQLFEFQAKTKDGRRHWVEVNLRRAVIGGHERLLTVVRDISLRKQTEEALRASEAKYRHLVEQIPAVTYIAGLDDLTHPLYISPQIEAILGFTPEDWLADSEMFKKQIHPEDRDRVLTELLLSYASGGPFSAEYRFFSKAGRVVWVRDESRAVYDYEGRPLFMQGVLMDITKRKRGEEALREANNKLKALVHASPLAIIGLNLQSKVVSWNPAAERIFGWRGDEVVGRPHPLALEEMRPEFKALWQRVLRGEELLGLELRHRRRDGSLMDLSLSTAPLYDGTGRLVGAMGVFEDITIRKSIEEALRKLSRALKAVTECDQALLRATDEAGLLSEVCRIIVEVGGYRMAWVGFARQDEEKGVVPMAHEGFEEGYIQTFNLTWADEPQGRGPVGTAIRTGKPAITRNTQTDPRFAPWRKEARKRGYASVLALPLGNARPIGALAIYAAEANAFDDEEINLLLGLANDLSYGIKALRAGVERQLAEEARRDSEQKLRLLTSQLLTFQEKERRRVSRELHDELGQGLTVLKIHLVDIEKKLRPDQPGLKGSCEKLLGFIDEVIENVRRLSWDLSPSILEDLGLSSSLKYLVQETCRNHQMLHALALDEIDELFSPEARINIYRIFQESLTNIVRHAEASRIDVQVEKHDNQVSFLIKDDGKGFDLKKARSRALSKRGLGLTTMHERALLAGGTLNLWSQKGKGTAIKLTVPTQS